LRNPFTGFADPVRRPRYIMSTFAVLFGLAAFIIVALGATSTFWFCDAGICHKVQDDTIRAYRASVHGNISCMACHEPVNADTITFLIAKAKNTLELIPTFGDTYEFPLNPGSALALKGGTDMGAQQCVQCHSPNREHTPSEGLIANHQAHEAAGIWCTICHNRVAHNDEAAVPVLVAPDGSKNLAHPDFMKMKACYRCHDLEGKVKMTGTGAKAASGRCPTCHPATFELVPESHKSADWPVKKHGEVSKEIVKEMAVQEVEAKALEEEGVAAFLAAPVNECFTCHIESTFCLEKCHGLEMPHPAGFAEDHKAESLKGVRVCQTCHLPGGSKSGVSTTDIAFCNDCHHKGGASGVPWLKAHAAVAQANGSDGCFECHSPVSCAKCHVRRGK
jgi:hypothetical protein